MRWEESYCLLGAIYIASDDWSVYPQVITTVASQITPNGIVFPESQILDWNDSPKRTKKDVLRLLDGLINALETA